MDIDEKIAEYKADIEKCKRVCEVTAIGSIRDAALRKAEDCKQMVEWLEDYKRMSSSEKPNKWIKADILDKIAAEVDEASTYDGIYIDRAYVFEIIDKYKAESEAEE